MSWRKWCEVHSEAASSSIPEMCYNMQNKHPNLLFIYTDEQAFNTLATYGNRQIEMPNLNRLAEESVVFDEAYVSQPVCTPSRSTLLTGLYPHTSGCTENNVPLRPETRCLPEMLTEWPKNSYDAASDAVSLGCSIQLEPFRSNTYAAPAEEAGSS